MNTSASRPHLFGLLAGLFLATGVSFASLVLARAWTHIHEYQIIEVTGSARKNVRADLVIWRANFSAEAPTLLEAQQKLKNDRALVEAWLEKKGMKDVRSQPVQIHEIVVQHSLRSKSEETSSEKRVGYRLTQPLVVTSSDVDLVPRLGSDATELIEQGVSFVSEGFEFIYTPVAEAKIEMMAEATKNARIRAEQIALQGGRVLKQLQTAHTGVVQINPLYSSATSWQGNNDTKSIDKTITATVSATFALQ
jgi:hypothetical protein